jgi:hypothetical protein
LDALSFFPSFSSAKIRASKRKKTTYMIAQTHTRTQVDVQKKKNIVVKDIINIDGTMPKGSTLHSFFLLSRPTNKSKKREKKKSIINLPLSLPQLWLPCAFFLHCSFFFCMSQFIVFALYLLYSIFMYI